MPPAQPPAGGGTDVPGGGNDPDDGDENMEDNDSDESSRSSDASYEGKPKDPEWAGTGMFYKTQTPNWKHMVKMFRRFCDLTVGDANTIVVYFIVYSKARLAEFLYEHWKDTIETVLSGRWSYHPLSKTVYIVPRGHVAIGATYHGLPSSSLLRT
jgi:hypothetical protein